MSRLHGVVTVEGVAAVWLMRELEERIPVIRAIRQPAIREPLLQLHADLRWAAELWREQQGMSGNGHADIAAADMGAVSASDEIDADEAMRLLGIRSDRHLRRLADAEGLGMKVGGQWRLSRTAVEALRARRRSA